MKLLLLRHGKSSWDDPSLADFDRPLAPRGRKAAERMGRELAARNWLPQLALVSPTARTCETWEVVAAALPGSVSADFSDTLYDATAEDVLSEIQRTPKAVKTLLILGHNPGLEDLARRLAGANSEAKALQRLREKFPTAALARFDFDGKWAELGFGRARLTHFLRPRDLG
ncbi:SixA phosphatase family protein [Allomesorhizobium camelthorni]|uniref:Histidine phosphatase family protein n=1 Tax=Allomesorhizobium camelthorni TaxID=475069 RepID=A0A6G4WCH2_9HYPH|nr:histidine phosphatase family protein [Mesorhizobium camelthorni]NGO52495.1 histidine phosphatase family protein [Mesorhizobium camelthorni]